MIRPSCAARLVPPVLSRALFLITCLLFAWLVLFGGLSTRAQGQYDVPRVSILDYYQYTFSPDQKVFAPAPTIHLVARFWNAFGTIIGATITVDGTPHPAVVSGNTITYDWDSSQALNPSEHTAFVTLTVKPNAYQPAVTYTSDQIVSPSLTGPYPSGMVYGDGQGRDGDFVVADLRLKTLQFNSNVPLNLDAVTLVPAPEFLWNPSSLTPTQSSPAGYIQATAPKFTMQVCDSKQGALTGTATMGYALKLTATPNTTNPSTHQPDPTLTLFDNSAGAPVAPIPFTTPVTVTATAPLDSWVAKYGASFQALGLYVEFTHVTPAPTWGLAISYNTANISNMLYAVVSTPTAPMAAPWIGVLDKGCDWAKRATNASDATTALVKGFYNNGNYQPGYTGYTKVDYISINPPIYVRDFQVNSFLNSGMTGPCWDFAAAMVCFSNAIGAVTLQMQTQQYQFTTNKITRANLTGNGSNIIFTSHAWSNAGGQIYDAAIKFGGTTNVTGLSGPLEASDYFNGLVSQPPSQGWSNGVTGLNSVNPTN